MNATLKAELTELAIAAMQERGLRTDFSTASLRQLDTLTAPGLPDSPDVHDLRALLWCSIDNDDSRDLDQLSVCQVLSQGAVQVQVAVADVDCLVAKDSPIDADAQLNTTSVYTGPRIFPMLPEKLSTDLTSLNPGVDRLAVVCDMVFRADGSIASARVLRAWVHNHAQLAYDAVSTWLLGEGPLPEAAAAVPGMDQQLRTQDSVAQQLRARRLEHGALEFQTFQPKAVFEGDQVVDIVQQPQNRARQLIEEFMIATNGVVAGYLMREGRPGIRRVVRSPERWARIVQVAAELHHTLPPEPDGPALEDFLRKQRARDPVRFPDLSLTIVKLMGSGEYVVERPGDDKLGHFGLAVRDYTHATAPNRRYPDLVTQRLVKAALAGLPPPYSVDELAQIATHCSRQETAADKVERQLRKSEAAVLLRAHVGELFNGVVTGNSKGNVWIRTFTPPAEGKLATPRAWPWASWCRPGSRPPASSAATSTSAWSSCWTARRATAHDARASHGIALAGLDGQQAVWHCHRSFLNANTAILRHAVHIAHQAVQGHMDVIREARGRSWGPCPLAPCSHRCPADAVRTPRPSHPPDAPPIATTSPAARHAPPPCPDRPDHPAVSAAPVSGPARAGGQRGLLPGLGLGCRRPAAARHDAGLHRRPGGAGLRLVAGRRGGAPRPAASAVAQWPGHRGAGGRGAAAPVAQPPARATRARPAGGHGRRAGAGAGLPAGRRPHGLLAGRTLRGRWPARSRPRDQLGGR
ncbi:ribonuclease catalytic domain-containing protein [Comamonas serinivorans]|uniref:ribonuclease catalytic domain-containing protein n=1 Tax=Comamonas serinivorans TaxID=1082851 RepID=UPI001EFF8BE1|nr:ribonuclease catalytic domain-containing protein [Comamonas serinivorans]